ncbi:hypothetical protein SAY86_031041 [Trapa natans]|uniref:ABC transporter domain-containing protein n=1 Tax=Trapa natans TaxID=22666 RepID=A0AAN7MNT7_TRANT|nr:hypothetical protein SAY86_031041 [Trapa natans]
MSEPVRVEIQLEVQQIPAQIVSPTPTSSARSRTGSIDNLELKASGSSSFAELLIRVEETHNGHAAPDDTTTNTCRIAVEDGSPPAAVPFVLAFNNLTYSVKVPQKMTLRSLLRRPLSPVTRANKVLLDDISGEAREGEIMAVLGASGSGKSTLIDALANRISHDSLSGSITLNRETLDSSLQKAISAYVMQDDLLFPMLTVEETLMFSAEFRLPRSLSRSRKRTRVRALIDQLGLQSATNTVIGDEGHRGVSGGERRRVSIGIDIIHDPILLFLDEPTSGLDSTSAFMVVRVLRRIAKGGSVVIMSIHQPSFRILSLIDQLIILSHGRHVYGGPPADLPQFFAGFKHPIPENENKIESALDLIRELEEVPGGTLALVDFNKSWQASRINSAHGDGSSVNSKLSLRDAICASVAKGKLVSGDSGRLSAAASGVSRSSVQTFANPFWAEMGVISKRSLTNSRRMPELFGIRFGAVMVTGIILATIYRKLDDSPKGVQERLGFFAFAMSTTFYTCAEAIPVFLQERYIFMRETAYNAYRRSSYVLAHSIITLPSLVVLSLAFSAVTFWPVGLTGGMSGFMFFFYAVLASFWAGNSFVTFLSGVISHVTLGFTVVVAILAYFVLMSGFFITRDRIPLYWIWFHYISLVKYPYESVLQNEFDNPARCFVKGVQMFDNTPLGAVPTSMKLQLLENIGKTLGVNITGSSCVTRGVDILRMQGITDIRKWNCLWITVAWGFFFRVLFYFALLLGSKNKRK